MKDLTEQQEVFDKVVEHLFTQGGPSFLPAAEHINGGNQCGYRGLNGRKCAIGIFIPDDKYDEMSMEGRGSAHSTVAKSLVHIKIPNKKAFLDELQCIHDNAASVGEQGAETWVRVWDETSGIAQSLFDFADKYRLDNSKVLEKWPRL